MDSIFRYCDLQNKHRDLSVNIWHHLAIIFDVVFLDTVYNCFLFVKDLTTVMRKLY